MKSLKELLVKIDACQEAQTWVGDKSIEEVVKTCPRGDWALWLASKLEIDLQTLTLAKALCAKTVIHLMKDQRSVDAILVAEKFGRGEATREELKIAAIYAADAADTAAAAYAAAYAAADAADAAYAASYAAYAADDAADTAAAAYAAAYAADAAAYAAYAAYAAKAKQANQLETANICREILGNQIIEKVNQLLVK